jgi:AhpD family alkylhydroperoxidase
MSTVTLIQCEDASPEVRAVFDDIKRTRNVPDVNNFWKALANQPETLRRTWEALREIMRPGALDPLVKEMLYVAVSIANNCDHSIHSHTAAARQGDDRGAVRGAAGGRRHGGPDQRPGQRVQSGGGSGVPGRAAIATQRKVQEGIAGRSPAQVQVVPVSLVVRAGCGGHPDRGS